MNHFSMILLALISIITLNTIEATPTSIKTCYRKPWKCAQYGFQPNYSPYGYNGYSPYGYNGYSPYGNYGNYGSYGGIRQYRRNLPDEDINQDPQFPILLEEDQETEPTQQ